MCLIVDQGGDTTMFGQEVIHTNGGISEFLPEPRVDDILRMCSTLFVRKEEREVSSQSENTFFINGCICSLQKG
jgi:hypothetical protein